MIFFYSNLFHLIVQSDGDGGDTAQREGLYAFYQGLTGKKPDERKLNYDDVLNELQVSPGVFVRNPQHNPITPPDKSWNDPTDFSRDQTTSTIAALGANKKFKLLGRVALNQLKRFTRFQNGDFMGPADLGNFIRASQIKVLYPLLLITDLGLVGESIIRIFAKPGDTSDDINHTLLLIQAQNYMATPISLFARKIYKHFRNVQECWDSYFSPQTGANPFNELYRDLIGNM